MAAPPVHARIRSPCLQFLVTALAVPRGKHPSRILPQAVREPRRQQELHLRLLRRRHCQPSKTLSALIHPLLKSQHLRVPLERLVLVPHRNRHRRKLIDGLHPHPSNSSDAPRSRPMLSCALRFRILFHCDNETRGAFPDRRSSTCVGRRLPEASCSPFSPSSLVFASEVSPISTPSIPRPGNSSPFSSPAPA